MGGRLDELLLARMGESGVEAPLEADRRRGLRAHPRAAKRARHVARVDLDPVMKLQQPLEAVEEALGALDGFDGQIGACRIADEERIAR